MVVLGAREMEKPETIADARLAAVLAGGRLCIDGLGDLMPAERTALLRAIDESPERLVLICASRREAAALVGPAGADRRGAAPLVRRARAGMERLHRRGRPE